MTLSELFTVTYKEDATGYECRRFYLQSLESAYGNYNPSAGVNLIISPCLFIDKFMGYYCVFFVSYCAPRMVYRSRFYSDACAAREELFTLTLEEFSSRFPHLRKFIRV